MKTRGILIVVSGFAGSGKGTLMKEIMTQYDNYALSISATTRKPRGTEVDGKEYFFKTTAMKYIIRNLSTKKLLLHQTMV